MAYLRQVLVQSFCLIVAQSFKELPLHLDHVSDGGLELFFLAGKDLVIVRPTSVPAGHPTGQLANNVRR